MASAGYKLVALWGPGDSAKMVEEHTGQLFRRPLGYGTTMCDCSSWRRVQARGDECGHQLLLQTQRETANLSVAESQWPLKGMRRCRRQKDGNQDCPAILLSRPFFAGAAGTIPALRRYYDFWYFYNNYATITSNYCYN